LLAHSRHGIEVAITLHSQTLIHVLAAGSGFIARPASRIVATPLKMATKISVEALAEKPATRGLLIETPDGGAGVLSAFGVHGCTTCELSQPRVSL